MSDVTFVQGDTAPPIRGTLKRRQDDGTYVVLDLSGVISVKFQMRKPDDVRFTVDAAATIVSAIDGTVRYDWVANDLDVDGEYIAQWELDFGAGRIQTTDPANTVTVRRQ